MWRVKGVLSVFYKYCFLLLKYIWIGDLRLDNYVWCGLEIRLMVFVVLVGVIMDLGFVFNKNIVFFYIYMVI